MALRTTNIDTTLVRNALGETNDNIFLLCTSALLNKWSRYKPIRDAGFGANWPAGSNSKYGLNLPTNWDYLQPRGGSPGGSPDEPGRIGDFRGYEHDKDIAGPVVFIDQNAVTLEGTLIPGVSGDGYMTGSITFQMNTAHNSVRIIPSDLGLQNYYWGIKLVLPGGGGTYYKTNSSVLGNGWVKTISVELTDLVTPAFADCPYAIGEFTWTAFISSTAAASWTTTAPSNIIYLPTGTYGSKTVVNSGTFTVNNWMVADDTSHSWLYSDYGLIKMKQSIIHTNSGLTHWHVISKPAWIDFKVYDEGGTLDITATPAWWTDMCILKLFPTEAQEYPDAERTGDIWLGDDTSEMEYIHVLQNAAPEILSITISKWAGDTSGLVLTNCSGHVTVGSSTLYLTFTPTGAGSTTLYYRIKYRTTVHGAGNIAGCTNGVPKSTTVNSDLAAASGDLVSVELSGDPII